MRIYLYKGFSKRENSTKRPSSSDDHKSVEVYLKDGTSILNPTFELAMTGVFDGEWSSIDDYNYARVDNWGRYYWITDVVYTNSTVEIVCKVDTLASWRNYIGSSTQYVLRSSNENAYDGNIQDTMYPCKAQTNKQVNYASGTTAFKRYINDGFYVVGIMENTTSIVQSGTGVNYYVLTTTEFMTMVYACGVYSNDTLGLAKPWNYIKSVNWYPFAPPYTVVSGNKIYIGFLTEFNVNARRLLGSDSISSGKYNVSWSSSPFKVTVPNHPQRSTRGNYLNSAPYTRYTLFNPLIGEVAIDTNAVLNHNYLFFDFKCDCITGDAICQVYVTANDSATATPRHIVTNIPCKMSVPVELGEIESNIINAIPDIVKTAGSVASLDALGTAQGIGNIANSIAPQVNVKGTQGSILPYQYEFALRSEHLLLVDEDIADRGRPTMKKLQLSSYPGYLVCADADIALPSTQSENIEVKGYLTSGFFFE